MNTLTEVINSFDNKDLGILAGRVSRAMRTGKSEAQIQRTIDAINAFVSTNWDVLSLADKGRATEHGQLVAPLNVNPERVTQITSEPDLEAAILSQWDNAYGVHYS